MVLLSVLNSFLTGGTLPRGGLKHCIGWVEVSSRDGLEHCLGELRDPNGAALFNDIGLPNHVSGMIVREAKRRNLTPDNLTPWQFDAPFKWLRKTSQA